MKKTSKESSFLKIGDYIKIVNYKHPELNPDIPLNMTISAPDSYKARKNEQGHLIIDNSEDDESDNTNGKLSQYTYTFQSNNYVGMEGIIAEIRDKPYCEYEKETGDIARYVIKLKSNLITFNNSILTLYPSQVVKINALCW